MRWRLLFPLLLAVACGGKGTPEPEHPKAPGPNAANDAARVRALDSVRVTDVPAGTFGPYVADGPGGSLVAWAAATGGGARGWFALALDADGKPLGHAQSLGTAAAEVGLALVEPASSGEADSGFVLLSTRREGERTVVEARRLDPKAKLLAGPLTIAEIAGDVIWLDIVPTSRATLALYGVRKGDGADLFAVPVPGKDDAAAGAVELASAARAWQAASFGAGAAIGLVLTTPSDVSGGRVEVALLGDDGKVQAHVPVSASPSAESDLDMVAAGSGLLLAWSDHRDVESHVYLSALDSGGKVAHPPAPAVSKLGEQALVRLVQPHNPATPAYLAWENLLERPAHGRDILVAPLGADGTVAKARAVIHHEATDSVPELSASQNGIAALTLAAACRKEKDCVGAPLLPTFVELGRSLELLVSEPVKITALAGEAPDLAWGLGCSSATCHVLCAQATDPAPVYRVALTTLSHDWQPAARQPEPSTPPRAAALEVVASLDPLADVAITRLDNASLGAWITYFDPATPSQRLKKPAPDGRFDPPRALLQVRPLGAAASPATISARARSLGGVTIAAASLAPAEALLGWTALDNKLPQVFATVVDASGKKLRQRMLTRAPGEKTDVVATGVGDGWITAWVDERAGDPEVYALRLNRQLMGIGPEKRITSAKGSAADVALTAHDKTVFLAWSDARDAERAGWADIFVATLAPADASPVSPGAVVAKTPLHSHSPALAPFGPGALLAWIDSSPADAGGNGEAEVLLVELDDKGHPRAAPIAVRPPQGTPTAVTVGCEAERCHLVMAVTVGETGMLQTFDYASAGLTRPKRLAALTGPASSTIVPALDGRELLYADRAGAIGRVRRMLIDWR
jgi:hypothetical protein